MKRIAVAVSLQVVTCLVTGTMLAMDFPPGEGMIRPILFIAAGYSQCALLASWAALARSSRLKRALGLICGACYLWLLLCFAMAVGDDLDAWLIAFALVTGPIALLTAVLAAAKRWKPGFVLQRESGWNSNSSGWQFSVRHVMAFALAVGGVLALGRAIQAIYKTDTLETALVCSVLAACVAEAAFTALWAALANGPIAVRLAAAMALAVLTGLIPPFYFELKPNDYVFVSSTAVASQAFLLGTFLVVRSYGYRLVRRSAASEAACETPAEFVSHPLD